MKPNVFIGSSAEGLDFAYAIQDNLEPYALVTVWTQDIFDLTKSTLDGLLKELDRADFGIFVFSPDDVVKIREQELASARDNVLFELGLFLGRLGVERNFFIIPRNAKDFRIPTDLLGITPARFDAERPDANWQASLGPACNKIRRAIEKAELSRVRKSEIALPATDFYFHIENKKSAKCLDVHGWSKNDGARVAQHTFHGGDNQLWSLEPVDGKYFHIVSKHSKKCLDVTKRSLEENAVVQQWECAGGRNQEWHFTALDDGSYKITARHSDKCLSVAASGTEDGAALVQASWRDSRSQKWWLKIPARLG